MTLNNPDLAVEILILVYNELVHASVERAILEWLNDADTHRSDEETVRSLADDWTKAAHRES